MKNTFAGKVRGIGDSVASAAGAASNAAAASYAAVKGSADKVGQSALEFGKSAGAAMGEVAQATSAFASKAGDAV